MAPQRQEDAPLTAEEVVLHCNLCLLGTAVSEGAKGLELSGSMFRKPNVKALEVVLYHMYTVIKGKPQARKVRAEDGDVCRHFCMQSS